MFNRNDIYTSSGSVSIYNAWTPSVAKFDTSSFYNWEQDNLPLYDLEERTYMLWEKEGFPTSSIPGIALTVSADAPISILQNNRNIFTSVSAAVASLPRTIRFPVLIEVANFGNLGRLDLDGIQFTENGSLEIINRAFGKIITASATAESLITSPTYNTLYPLVSQYSSLDLSNTIRDTSCLHISSLVFSSGDSRASSVTTFLYSKINSKEAPLTASIRSSSFFAGTNLFSLTPYENVNVTSVDDSLDLDYVSLNQYTENSIRRDILKTSPKSNLGGVVYFNHLTEVNIKNCSGRIFIRNFFCDGEFVRNDGFNILNSQVVLENCSAARFKNSGFNISNSRVNFSRSSFSYRNYSLITTTTRDSELGTGYKFNSSQIQFSSNPTNALTLGDTGASGQDALFVASRNTTGFYLNQTDFSGGYARTSQAIPESGGIIASELNTKFGLQAINSDLNTRGILDLFGNSTGFLLENSRLRYEFLCCELNGLGGDLFNSKLIFDSNTSPTSSGQLVRRQTQFNKNGQHLILNNSIYTFELKNSVPTLYGVCEFMDCHGVIRYEGLVSDMLPAISVRNNSTLHLLKTKFRSRQQSDSKPNSPAFGLAIHADNSEVGLFGTNDGPTLVWGPAGYSYQKYVCGIFGQNNSVINVHGPTLIAQFGVDILGENNSTVNIEPHRYRSGQGYEVSAFNLNNILNHTSVELHSTRACLVVDKNSVLNMRDCGSYPDLWDNTASGLAYLNQTVDYNLQLNNLSSYLTHGAIQFYPNAQNSLISSSGVDNLTALSNMTTFPTFTNSGQRLSFLVNDSISSPSWNLRRNVTTGGVCVRAINNSIVNVTNVHFPLGTNESPLDGLVYNLSGSDCERFMIWNIADDSKLKASFLSVSGAHPISTDYHGPSAFYASSVNGTSIGPTFNVPAYGAPSGTPDSGRLSVLDSFGAGSSVLTIPFGIPYNGPFDYYYTFSGGLNTQTRASLAGAGIPVSSIPNQFIGSPVGTYLNRGPFRIYFSPKSSAKILLTDVSGYFKGAFPYTGTFSGTAGEAYQIFAQGYNCSAPLSSIVPTGQINASGLYPDLLKLSWDFDGDGIPDRLWTSGFYYCSEFLEDNPTQCLLDESASFTFANSRNASLGTSGRPKRVTIYLARNEFSRGSESYEGDSAIGFKSSSIFDLTRDN